jgi:CHAT domain-containing protein
MWPVETTSAKKITTGLFLYQKNHPLKSKAKALQNTMTELIDNATFRDPQTGLDAASYAHPLFWAPFIVFGDGGKRVKN